MPYLRASYIWSSAFVSTSSGLFLSIGKIGNWAIDDLQLLIERMEKNYDELVSVSSYLKIEEEQSQKKITEFIDRLKKFVDFLENNAMSEA